MRYCINLIYCLSPGWLPHQTREGGCRGKFFGEQLKLQIEIEITVFKIRSGINFWAHLFRMRKSKKTQKHNISERGDLLWQNDRIFEKKINFLRKNCKKTQNAKKCTQNNCSFNCHWLDR